MITRQRITFVAVVSCVLTCGVAAIAASAPNLTPYKPFGWSDKIVVTRSTGSTTDDTDLTPTDTLYVNWAVINSGNGATSTRFYTELYVDGIFKETWKSEPPVDLQGWVYVNDYPIGSLSAGQHTFRIKTDGTSTNAETNESDNEYTKTIIIGAGQTIIGVLTDTDAESHGRSGAKADYYTLTGSGNVTITLRSSDFDAYLYLYNQNKQQVTYNDDGAGGSNSRISYTLVAGQTYYVEATSFYTGGRGAYALTANTGTLTAVATPWPPAPPNLTPYKPFGWSDKIVVTRSTGSTTDDTDLTPTDTLYVNWAVINNGGSATTVRFFTELYVDGVLVHQWGGSPPYNPSDLGYINDYPLASLSAGQHTIRIKTDSTGAIAESNENDNEYTKAITIGAGQTVNGALADADAESHGRSGKKADYYTLTGSGNVTITLRSSAFDAYLYLYNQNKQQVTYNDDGAGGSNSRISYTLVAGQTYYVEATSFYTGERGSYALMASTGTLTVVGTPWPPAPPIEVQNNIPLGALAGGQDSQKLYKITVPSGQSRLDISISGGSGDCDLYARRGTPPTTSSYDPQYRPYLVGNNETVSVSNPASGDWYIMLNGYTSYEGVRLASRYGPAGMDISLITGTARLLGVDLFQKYEQGTKYLLYGAGDWGPFSLLTLGIFDFGPTVGAAIYIDIADYLGITNEGWNDNWVTLWLRINGCVFGAGLPVSAGVQARSFDASNNLPDREFPGEVTAINANVIGVLSLSGLTLTTDGNFTGGSLEPLDFGFYICAGAWMLPSFSVEVQRESLNSALAHAFSPGMTAGLIGPALMSQLVDSGNTKINRDNQAASSVAWRGTIRGTTRSD